MSDIEVTTPGTGYSGDVTCAQAWEILETHADAELIDVRTNVEWNFVGITDLSDLGKQPLHVSWQILPGMTVNADFASAIREQGLAADAPLLFICRSGVRSIAAAQAMTAAGFSQCFNVLEGFEGNLDGSKHRSTVGGWKMRDLPWQQS